jgi:hypothetical protein
VTLCLWGVVRRETRAQYDGLKDLMLESEADEMLQSRLLYL